MRIARFLVAAISSLALAAASLLLTLVVIEGALRAFAPVIGPYLFPVLTGWKEADWRSVFEYDERLAKDVLRPVERFRHLDVAGREFDYEITTTACRGAWRYLGDTG